MSFHELAARRISVRGYRPDPVPPDVLARILETARMAPSAANRQPWHIVVLRAEADLGTCWIAAFSPTRLRAALRLPDGILPLAITPLGVPADPGRPKQRKPLQEILHDGGW